jgi:hypothetical protein
MSPNLACGFHAGDLHVMRKSVALALQHCVAIGAHPELPRRRRPESPVGNADLLPIIHKLIEQRRLRLTRLEPDCLGGMLQNRLHVGAR